MVTVLTWGFNFVAIKILYSEFPPAGLALLRYLGTALFLLAVCLIRKESLRTEKSDFWRVQFAGFLSTGLYLPLFMKGMEGTTPAEGAIVLATAPVFTYLLSCVVGQEKFAGGALIGSLVAFVGVVTVILGGQVAGHGSLSANLIVLLSSVVWAFSAVVTRPLVAKYGPLPTFTMGMPAALPTMLLYGGASLAHTNFARVDTLGWLMYVFVFAGSGGIGFVFFYRGIQQIGAGGATLYQYFVPPVAALSAWLVMGKTMVPLQLAGFVVVLTGVVLSGMARSRATVVLTPVPEP